MPPDTGEVDARIPNFQDSNGQAFPWFRWHLNSVLQGYNVYGVIFGVKGNGMAAMASRSANSAVMNIGDVGRNIGTGNGSRKIFSTKAAMTRGITLKAGTVIVLQQHPRRPAPTMVPGVSRIRPDALAARLIMPLAVVVATFNAAVTNGSAVTITDTQQGLTKTMVGRDFWAYGAGSGGALLHRTIVSVQNPYCMTIAATVSTLIQNRGCLGQRTIRWYSTTPTPH